MQAKYIYMKVTHDKYELPLFVADTMGELSRMCGTSVANISHSISHREERGWYGVCESTERGAGNDMTLKECTKDELLYIIKRLSFPNRVEENYTIQRALVELEYKREGKKLNEAERLNKVADEKLAEYNSIISPYIGKSYAEIPDNVLKKAAAVLKEREAAEDKWMRLMGIKQERRKDYVGRKL